MLHPQLNQDRYAESPTKCRSVGRNVSFSAIVYIAEFCNTRASCMLLPGRVSDKYFTEQSGLLDKLLPNDVVLAEHIAVLLLFEFKVKSR